MAIRGKIRWWMVTVLLQACVVGWLAHKGWSGIESGLGKGRNVARSTATLPAAPVEQPAPARVIEPPIPVVTVDTVYAIPDFAEPVASRGPDDPLVIRDDTDLSQEPRGGDIAAFLADATPDVLLAIARQQAGTPEGREALTELLRRQDLPAGAREALVQFAHSEADPSTLEAVARSLGWFEEPAAGAALRHLLAHGPTPGVRRQAVTGLVDRGDNGALPALAAAAADDASPEVRGEAAAALGLLGDDTAVASLARLAATERDGEVLARIQEAFRSLRPEAYPIEAVPGVVPSAPVGKPCRDR